MDSLGRFGWLDPALQIQSGAKGAPCGAQNYDPDCRPLAQTVEIGLKRFNHRRSQRIKRVRAIERNNLHCAFAHGLDDDIIHLRFPLVLAERVPKVDQA